MTRTGWSWVCLAMTLAACQDSYRGNGSSGSNWLTCETSSDCASPEAVACDAEGYCIDAEGQRIAAPHADSPDAATHTTAVDAGDPGVQITAGDAGNPDMQPTTGDAGDPEPCAWDVDAQLAKADVMAPDRIDCGRVLDFTPEVSPAWDCFEAALDAGDAVEVTVDACADCAVAITYVGLPSGERYAVTRDDFASGEHTRESRVEICEELSLTVVLDTDDFALTCFDPSELYRCVEVHPI